MTDTGIDATAPRPDAAGRIAFSARSLLVVVCALHRWRCGSTRSASPRRQACTSSTTGMAQHRPSRSAPTAEPQRAGARRHRRRATSPNPRTSRCSQRADIVDQATDILEQMLDDLVAIAARRATTTASAVDVFAENYRMIIADRRALHRSAARASSCEPYRETLVDGGPVTQHVIDFTTGNAMPHCMPPGELGGDA